MICEHCRKGGNLTKRLRERWPNGRPGGRGVESNQYTGQVRRINNLHGKCKGCTCQHVGTPHALTKATR